LFEHIRREVRCDICGQPRQQGETDVVNLVADPNIDGPVLKSVDVCRECRSRPISDLLAKLVDLGHVFGPRVSSEQVDD